MMNGKFVADLHEQKSYGSEEEFTHSANDADEHSNVSSHAHLGDRHRKASFAPPQLKG